MLTLFPLCRGSLGGRETEIHYRVLQIATEAAQIRNRSFEHDFGVYGSMFICKGKTLLLSAFCSICSKPEILQLTMHPKVQHAWRNHLFGGLFIYVYIYIYIP